MRGFELRLPMGIDGGKGRDCHSVWRDFSYKYYGKKAHSMLWQQSGSAPKGERREEGIINMGAPWPKNLSLRHGPVLVFLNNSLFI